MSREIVGKQASTRGIFPVQLGARCTHPISFSVKPLILFLFLCRLYN
jgi:hypothetical protein